MNILTKTRVRVRVSSRLRPRGKHAGSLPKIAHPDYTGSRNSASPNAQTSHRQPCLPDYNCCREQRGYSLSRLTSPSRPSYTPSCTSSSARLPSSPPSQTPREPTATASAAVAVPAQARARRPEEVTRVRSSTVKCRSDSMVVRHLISWCPEREVK